MLLLILAIAGSDPSAEAAPDGKSAEDGFIWVEQSIMWTEVPDPDPDCILPPIKGLRPLGAERSAQQPKIEAERNFDEALRSAREAVDRAKATVQAAQDK